MVRVVLGEQLRGPEHQVLAPQPRPSTPPAPRCCRRSGETITCRCPTRSPGRWTPRPPDSGCPGAGRHPSHRCGRSTGRSRSGRTGRLRDADQERVAQAQGAVGGFQHGWPPLTSSTAGRCCPGWRRSRSSPPRSVAGEVAERIAGVRGGGRRARGRSAKMVRSAVAFRPCRWRSAGPSVTRAGPPGGAPRHQRRPPVGPRRQVLSRRTAGGGMVRLPRTSSAWHRERAAAAVSPGSGRTLRLRDQRDLGGGEGTVVDQKVAPPSLQDRSVP